MPIAAPTIDMIATGANIRALTVFGFNTPQAIFKWMRGDAMPSIDNIVILAHILGVPIDEIIITN